MPVQFQGDLTVGGNITVGTATTDGSLVVRTHLALEGDSTVSIGATSAGIQVGALMLNTAGETLITGPDGRFIVRNRFLTGREDSGSPWASVDAIKNLRSVIGTGSKTGGAAILKVVDKSVSFRDGFDLVAGGVLRSGDDGAEVYLGEYDGTTSGSPSTINKEGVVNLKGGVLDGGRHTLTLLPFAHSTNTALVAKSSLVAKSGYTSDIRGTVRSYATAAIVEQGATLRVYGTIATSTDAGKSTWSVATADVSGRIQLGRTFTAADPDIADAAGGARTSGTVSGVIRYQETGADGNGFVLREGGAIVSTMTNFDTLDSLTPWAGNNIIGAIHKGAANPGVFRTEAGSNLDMTDGSLVMDMIHDGHVAGTLTYGVSLDATSGNRRIYSLLGTRSTAGADGKDTNFTLDAGSKVVFTNQFLTTVSDEDVATKYNTIIDLGTEGNAGTLTVDESVLKQVWNVGFMGTYNLALQDNNKLYVDVNNRAAKFDGTYEDYAQFRAVVAASGENYLGSDGLLMNVYRNAVNYTDPDAPLNHLVGDPNDFSVPYNEKLNPMAALHRGYFNAFLLRQIMPGDTSAANLYTGANGGRVLDVAQRSVDKFGKVVFDHFADTRRLRRIAQDTTVDSDMALAAMTCAPTFGGRLWASGFGLWEDADKRGDFEGYKYNSGGVVTGYDQFIGDFTVGAGFAYTSGDFKDKSAVSNDSDIDSYSFALNATYHHQSGFFASLAGIYTYSDNEISELRNFYNVNTGAVNQRWNHADYHSKTWSVKAELGYEFRLMENLFVTPSVGYTYIRSKSKDHNQYIDGDVFARYNGLKKDGSYLPVRVNVEYMTYCAGDSRLSLFANAGYAYNFSDDDLDGTVFINGFNNATPISAEGRKTGRHNYNLGAGVKYGYRNFDFAVQYDYYGRAKYDAHQVTGTVGFSF